MSMGDLPLASAFPSAIEIQTTAACNAGCIICPHSEVWNEGHRGQMDDELFDKILADCAEYQGNLRLIPYLNAEPLLDAKFSPRVRRINSMVPQAVVELSTNVAILNARIRDELCSVHIHDLRLSVFGFTEETHRKLMPGLRWPDVWRNLLDLVQDDRLRKTIDKISLTMIDHPLVPLDEYRAAADLCSRYGLDFNHWDFLDRSGNVRQFTNNVFHERVAGCGQGRPLQRLHVLFDGRVILCCQDWRASVVLGDLRRQSIREVWHSEAYNRVKRAIYGTDKTEQPEVCLRCKMAVPACSSR